MLSDIMQLLKFVFSFYAIANPLRNQGKRPKSVNLAAPPEWSGIDRSFRLLSVMLLQENGGPEKAGHSGLWQQLSPNFSKRMSWGSGFA